jgi:hypothetical protein
VQGAENYIDELCGIAIDDLEEAGDAFPCDTLMVRGWIVVPDLHVAGRVDLCLVQEGGPLHVFAETGREGREDVLELFPDAPSRSGFLARLTLSGKWSDGEYRAEAWAPRRPGLKSARNRCSPTTLGWRE